MTPPRGAWLRDPSREYDLRYWDGAAWTEHVWKAGAQGVSPLPPEFVKESRRGWRSGGPLYRLCARHDLPYVTLRTWLTIGVCALFIVLVFWLTGLTHASTGT